MSGGLFFKDSYGRRIRVVIMVKILVLGGQAQLRRLLSESLLLEGHLVESFGDAAMLWDHLRHTQPDLVLLDAHLDGFGTVKLLQNLKQKFPGRAVMVCQCRNYGDVDRIKEAVADALGKKNAAPRSDNMPDSQGATIDN
jgi:DNA-binding NtrC family response regulator